ncbi:hypothetical protein [Cupriavidus plantarum]|uniref:Uncharacterized protein n=1 Tax=Cupriavidus plantarum TaxID=942865 RepID=A0A316F3J8_9BURK|nr:hypothetical protein [Cupriavidus plantarum]NYH98281.1 hypothetical protein [Cupriavidus plantarum]PWK38089.1 hypothetical protein C7419_1011978 [Cupriavidus plantarum]REE91740.1 hypothetical protein C7418_2997 [Cupriavidus plantarum]RLK45929.1 hypothetical protein C7417_1958 [Cupriavidus plantarum]CAG2127717.1 hypothetical protein LMG26296_00759 [Cupriavidus plantarum]
MHLLKTIHRSLPVLAGMLAAQALAVAPDPGLADTSGCTAMLDIVQESLRSEIEVVCNDPNKPGCDQKNGQIRVILDIIDHRRQRGADECDTIAQVNRLLRTLPPRG